MRAAHQLVQRESIHVRVVLAGVRLVRERLRSDRMGYALLLLERALPVRQISHRANAARVAFAQVHLQGLCLSLSPTRRLSRLASHCHEFVRPGRVRAHQRAVAKVHRKVPQW